MKSLAESHLEIGKQKFYRYDREGALDEFRLALSANSSDPQVSGWIAVTLILLERFEEAEEFLGNKQNHTSPEIFIAKATISYIK